MKISKLIIISWLVIIWCTLLIASVSAQSILTVTPSELSATTTRNNDATVSLTLLLHSTETITSLQIIPLDLTRMDGQATIPAANIRSSEPITQLDADTPASVPIVFNLGGIPSGEFKGELWITYPGETVKVPITITIRDTPILPLVVLFLGVGLGLVVSGYRTQGKPRDELLVRIGQIRTEVRTDTDLAPSFQSVINAALIEAEAALQSQDWTTADQALEQAETTWLKWRKNRSDWLEQLTYAQELLDSEDIQGDSRYLKTVARNTKDAVRDAPDLPNGPRELNQKLEELADQLSKYLQLQSDIEKLGQEFTLSDTQRGELVSFQSQLDAMLPGEEEKYTQLKAAVANLRTTLLEQTSKDTVAVATRSITISSTNLPLPVPSLRFSNASTQTVDATQVVAKARSRLRWFTWVVYLIAIILLVGVGFNQLYLAQSTFGANPWSDYFALFLWGFAAEASRAAITDVLRNLDLPGVK